MILALLCLLPLTVICSRFALNFLSVRRLRVWRGIGEEARLSHRMLHCSGKAEDVGVILLWGRHEMFSQQQVLLPLAGCLD